MGHTIPQANVRMDHPQLQQARQHISDNNLDLALDSLEGHMEENTLISLRRKLHEIQKLERDGRATKEVNALALSNFTHNLLEELSILEEDLEPQSKLIIQIPKNEAELKEILTQQFAGRYRLISEIPNMHNYRSIIYKAEDLKSSRKNSFRAIKVIKPYSIIEEENLAHIHSDLAQLENIRDYNGIIDIIDINVSSYPWYIVMDFVEGVSLRGYLSKGWTWQVEEAIEMLQEIIETIWNCHQEGIIHGNLRPKKILLNKRDHNKPLISPFRILKDTFFNRRTHETMMSYSQYLSPEELYGEEADELSDQFSVGLIAYELLESHPLFNSDSVGDLIKQRFAHKDNPKFVSESMTNKACPQALKLLVQRMLSHSRSDRFEQLSDIPDELDSIKLGIKQHKKSLEQGKEDQAKIRRAIQNSYDRCRKQNDFLPQFYTAFFGQCPVARSKFKSLEHQYNMLDVAIDRLVNFPHQHNRMYSKMKALGEHHNSFAVKPEMYQQFKKALVDTMRTFDAKKWNEELEEHWNKLLDSGIAMMNGLGGV